MFKRPALFKSLLSLALLLVGIVTHVHAHRPDQNYIYLRIYQSSVDCRFELKKGDISEVFGFEFKQGELPDSDDPRIIEIRKYLEANFRLTSNQGAHGLDFVELDLFELNTGDFVLFKYNVTNMDSVPARFDVYDNVFLEELDGHESLLHIEFNWKTGVLANEALPSLIFGPSSKNQVLELEEGSILTGFIAMVKSGVYHIWIGLDHILFLVALLIPSVIVYRSQYAKKKWFGIPYSDYSPKQDFKSSFIEVVKIITIFTLAHSVTLSLAALELVMLPSMLVESIIALSIAVAAYHNINPFFMKESLIILIFGLFHGFGFASVLAEQARGGDYLVYSLVGFNLGVELGQLAIILVVFPILFAIRNWRQYSFVMVGFSLVLIAISMYWMVERVFDIDLKLKTWLLSLF